jgi:cation diffusion facilitator family transporter
MQLSALIIGLALMSIKFVAWWLTNSNAILSDALESIINVVAGTFALFSLLFAARPRDRNHPYGHGKIEFLSAGFEGVLIMLAGVAIISKAIYNLYYPQALEGIGLGLLLTAIAGGINFLLGWILETQGQKTNSVLMVASGKHLKSDGWSSLGLITGLGLVLLTGINQFDNLLALIFGGVIIYTGLGLVRTSLAGILDEADYELVKNIVQNLDEHRSLNWIDIHNLRIIKYGALLHIDCHMTLPWYFNLQESHEEVKILEAYGNQQHANGVEFFVHLDPCLPDSCPICQKTDCPARQHPFEHRVVWTLENVMENKKHQPDNAQLSNP